jgi:hypothetical protein
MHSCFLSEAVSWYTSWLSLGQSDLSISSDAVPRGVPRNSLREKAAVHAYQSLMLH